MLNRRSFLTAAVGGAALKAVAQTPAPQAISPNATPRDWSNQVPVRYPEPDVVALDNRFHRYIVGQYRHQEAPYRNALGRRSGLERRGTLSGLERHS